MRPRDIIQLCNACRDIAEKNGSSTVRETDIQEALSMFSGWKLNDLVNEYRVNYPFLNDLFVLFSNNSYIVTRQQLVERLLTLKEALVARYREFGNSLSLDGILQILYTIGFVGVIRDGRTVFVYQDPNTIEPKEADFVIHPAFREAVRSTSSVDAVPYERIRTSQLRDYFMLERAQAHNAPYSPRGGRPFRQIRYLTEAVYRVKEVALRSKVPEEVRSEMNENLEAIVDDLKATAEYGGFTMVETTRRILDYFTNLVEKLRVGGYLKSNKDLDVTLASTVEELMSIQRGGFLGLEYVS
jgi:hypothetical protein